MGRLTYTYALITALYDERQDYLDAFWPFVAQAFPNSGYIARDLLRSRLHEEHGLDVPSHVLRLLLYRAQVSGYVQRRRQGTSFTLTDEGLRFKAGLETPREVERRINSLIADGVAYFAQNGRGIESESFSDLMTGFVQANLDKLMEFLDAKPGCGGAYNATGEEERLLVRYIAECEIGRPDAFSTLLDVVRGSILAAVICTGRSKELSELRAADLSGLEVYLDTNFLLAALGYENEELVGAAKEMMNLLRTARCAVKVFPFTVDEICSFLGAYSSHEGDYYADVVVRSAYSAMRTAGVRRSDVQDAVVRMPELIREAGIETLAESAVDLATSAAADPRIGQVVRRYKPGVPRPILKHDVAAIEAVQRLRGGRRARKLQDAKAVFLSSDVRLSRASFEGLQHKSRGTVAEVVHDGVLASILWLRSPGANPPLKSIVAAHSKNLFVDRRVWERFLEVVQSLREQGEVHDDDLADLLYRDYIAVVLMDIDVAQVQRVDKQFVLEEVDKARRARLQQRETDIEALKTEQQEKLRAFGKGIEAAWRGRIQGELDDVETRSARTAAGYVVWACVGGTILYIALVAGVSYVALAAGVPEWGTAVSIAATLLAPGSVVFWLWLKGRRTIAGRIADRLFLWSPERERLERLLGAGALDQRPEA